MLHIHILVYFDTHICNVRDSSLKCNKCNVQNIYIFVFQLKSNNWGKM